MQWYRTMKSSFTLIVMHFGICLSSGDLNWEKAFEGHQSINSRMRSSKSSKQQNYCLTCLLTGDLSADMLFGSANPLLRVLLTLLLLLLGHTLLLLSMTLLWYLLFLSFHPATTLIAQVGKNRWFTKKLTVNRTKRTQKDYAQTRKMFIINRRINNLTSL